MTTAIKSALYEGSVFHARHRPKAHRLRYDVFYFVLDLDELPELDRRFSAFGYNRRAPFSFLDRDHGPGRDEPLRPWVEEQLAAAGISLGGGKVMLMCYPRVCGYVFNPISVYFCYRRDGALAAMLYEVGNTFGERHIYLIPVIGDGDQVIHQSCEKRFYVSPFLPMDCTYHFRIRPPAERLGVSIRQDDDDGVLLVASFQGRHRVFDDARLYRCLFRFPFLTIKVIVGIHWEAARLWLKGLKVFRHLPARSRVAVSVVNSTPWRGHADEHGKTTRIPDDRCDRRAGAGQSQVMASALAEHCRTDRMRPFDIDLSGWGEARGFGAGTGTSRRATGA